jgi:hypothetical protein
MTGNATLRCRCGEVRGVVAGVSLGKVNRVICYCDDCQAFLHYLGRADLLDAHGGTDIVQLAPAWLSFVQGTERIVGLRLTPKGIYRWYASCCRTPLGNMVGPAIPYIGIVVQAFASEARSLDDLFGHPIGAIYGKHAVAGAPPGSTGFTPRLFARAIGRVLAWRLRGQSWPHPFFERATRKPGYPVTTLTREEREALRPLCGPHPSVRSN